MQMFMTFEIPISFIKLNFSVLYKKDKYFTKSLVQYISKLRVKGISAVSSL
jgi:hypothetical protein